MADCPPTYLIAWDGDTPVAGAALFKIHNEPLPLPEVARRFMSSVFKHRPLLICRSPLAERPNLIQVRVNSVMYFGDHLRLLCSAGISQSESVVKLPLSTEAPPSAGDSVGLEMPPEFTRIYALT